ncbi:enoyl-CoA hydratase-related protein [Pararhizobium haloflavum]|uniref:enoyl-CoA hydratase-related protein n=1 Tax=Pararhizobium haloflavum TaxID=2037914 RepID=UPI000C184B43|nr:enoyl-CoA hydratase-related protein [Pararhizobium haloflavum]
MTTFSDTPETAPPILVEQRGALTAITLNRPQKLNALTEALLIQLADALKAAQQDQTVRAVLLTGAGKAFCAGQDLADRDPRKHAEPFDLEAIQTRLFHPVVRLMREMEKPVVVAVSGVAAGAGAAIALAADIILAADDARFILSFAKVGLSVDAGAGFALVQALGPARARGLMLTGGTLTGREAVEAGLAFKSVPSANLTDEIDALTTALAEGPTAAYGAIKKAVQAAHTSDFETYLAEEARLQGLAGKTSDYREGVLAFLEKRQATFRGR